MPPQTNYYDIGQQIWLYHAYSTAGAAVYHHPSAPWIKTGYSEIDVFEIGNQNAADYTKVPIATHYWPSGGLYTTSDGGSTPWNNDYKTGLNYEEIRCLVKNSSNTYAGTDGGIYIYNGTSWSAMSPQIPKPVKAIAINGSTIFAGTDEDGVYSYNGSTWTQVNPGLSNTKVRALLVTGSTILVGTENGIYYSPVSSISWTQQSSSNGHYINALAQNGSSIYAGTNANGVYKLNSSGSTYTSFYSSGANQTVLCLLSLGSDIFAGTVSGLYRSDATTNVWNLVGFSGQNVASLAGYGTSPTTVVAGVNSNGINMASSSNWSSAPSWTNVGSYSNDMDATPVSCILLPNSNSSDIWVGATTIPYYYNNPTESSVPAGETFYTAPTSVANTHKYGVNWQKDYVDFYMDDKLYSHQTMIRHSDGVVVPVSRLQPMPVLLSTIFVAPSSPPNVPPVGQDQDFKINYFRYYKMTPEIINLTYNSGVISIQAAEGIDKEDYSWSVTSGAATITGVPYQNDVYGSANVTVNSGVSEIQVTSTTGSSRDDEPLYDWLGNTISGATINPSTSASTKIKISSANCWNMCQSDIATPVSNFWARCINAPGSPCTSFNVPDTGNQHGIKLIAQTGIQLNAGFNVANGYSFEAVCH